MSVSPLQSYRDLRVWREAIAFVKRVYALTGTYPSQERFGLISQMRRAAVSIPSNIAEGHARIGTNEYLHHLSIALGSVAELDTQIIISEELNFLSRQDSSELIQQLDVIGKMLRRLYQSLKSQRVGDSAAELGPSDPELVLSEEQETWNPDTRQSGAP